MASNAATRDALSQEADRDLDSWSAVGLIEPILETFEAAGAHRGVVYLSVPITSGRREFELLAALNCTRSELRTTHRDRWLHEVVRPNEEDARLLAAQVRQVFDGLMVIDPSRVHIAEWGQDQYDRLWSALIQTYARRIVLAPGWAYSRGARLEVSLALDLMLPVFDPLGEALEEHEIVCQAHNAVSELRKLPVTSTDVEPYLPLVERSSDERPSVRTEPNPDSAAAAAFAWLVAERRYQVRKFGTDVDDEHTRQGVSQDGWWWQQLINYFHRAHILGLEHPGGRQALAKFTATACGLLESVIRVHGTLPPAGVPSGELGDGRRT